MLIGSTLILGPIPARNLDPMILVESQPPEMRGYVLLAPGARADPPGTTDERAWMGIFLAGNPEPDVLRLTEIARTRVEFSCIRDELQKAGKEGRTVHLFEAPERLLRDFLSTLEADPVLKVTLDSLDLRHIEALLASSPVRRGLLERSDLTGDLPRIELVRVSTFVDELGLPFTLPQLQLGYEKGGMALYRLDGVTATPASETPPKGAPPAGQPQKAAPRAGAKRRPAEPVKPSLRPSAAPVDEADAVLIIFQRLFRSFRKKGVDCLGRRWEDALRSAVERVRFLGPEFQPDALTHSTAPMMLDLILEVVSSAPILKRSRLRDGALLLIADIYDKQYDVLESRGLVDRVEQAYLRLKK